MPYIRELEQYEYHFMEPVQYERSVNAIQDALWREWAKEKRESIETDLMHDNDMREDLRGD